MNGLAISLHVLAAVIWVGGMFFAYMALRPAALKLEPPQRLMLWSETFERFFPWVWGSVVVLPFTGYWMIFTMFGGFDSTPLYALIMQYIGIAMIAIFLHVFFAPYRRLRRFVAAEDFPAAGKQLAQIRKLIALNLSLGLITVVIASSRAL
ncbi:MAG: CopD family protein [Acidiferrobacterales bacterium]